MPLPLAVVWSLTRMVLPAERATPSTVWVPDRVRFAPVLATMTVLEETTPPAILARTHCRVAASVGLTGSAMFWMVWFPRFKGAVMATVPSDFTNLAPSASLEVWIAAAAWIWASAMVPAMIWVVPRTCVLAILALL